MLTNNRYLAALMLMLVAVQPVQAELDRMFSSGLFNGNQVDILVNSPNGSVCYEAPGGVAQLEMQNAWNITGWQRAALDMPPSGHIGFWYPSPELTLNPIYYGGTQAPDLSTYIGLDLDATGDHLYNSQWLDIAVLKHSFSADRLYFAMQCMGGSYPVSSGLTYFAYMPVLVDPDSVPEDNPIVYGLMYTVSVPGVISPGLYKITGTGFSGLSRIGDIETSVQDGHLLLSCAISDLLADPDFNAWFDPQNPRIANVATTSRITLINGIQQADITPGLDLLLRPQAVPLQNSSAPVLSEAGLLETPDGLLIPRISYFDADQNFPRVASFSVDGGEEYPLSPMDLGAEAFAAAVVFGHPGIPEPESWSELRFRFSHGDTFEYHTYQNSSDNHDDTIALIPKLELYPNPATHVLNFKSGSDAGVKLAIYNLKGQKLDELILDGKSELSLNLKDYMPGVYFVKSLNGNGTIKRFVKM